MTGSIRCPNSATAEPFAGAAEAPEAAPSPNPVATNIARAELHILISCLFLGIGADFRAPRTGLARGAQDELSPGTGRSSFMQRSKNGDLFVRLLPRRAAVAPQLIADPRIRVGAKYLASHVIPDTRAAPVHLSRGSVVRLRAGLRDRRCCHESGA
jgi:hypothetical protein